MPVRYNELRVYTSESAWTLNHIPTPLARACPADPRRSSRCWCRDGDLWTARRTAEVFGLVPCTPKSKPSLDEAPAPRYLQPTKRHMKAAGNACMS